MIVFIDEYYSLRSLEGSWRILQNGAQLSCRIRYDTVYQQLSNLQSPPAADLFLPWSADFSCQIPSDESLAIGKQLKLKSERGEMIFV